MLCLDSMAEVVVGRGKGMVTMVALLWLVLYKMGVAKPDFAKTSTKICGNMTIIDKFLKEVLALINSSGDLSRSSTLRENYRKIRKSGNSLKKLIESLSHTFIEPKSFHKISKFCIAFLKINRFQGTCETRSKEPVEPVPMKPL